MTLPTRECALGYTAAQVDAIMDGELAEYHVLASGKARGFYPSKADGAQPCVVAHDIVGYTADIERFLDRRR